MMRPDVAGVLTADELREMPNATESNRFFIMVLVLGYKKQTAYTALVKKQWIVFMMPAREGHTS